MKIVEKFRILQIKGINSKVSENLLTEYPSSELVIIDPLLPSYAKKALKKLEPYKNRIEILVGEPCEAEIDDLGLFDLVYLNFKVTNAELDYNLWLAEKVLKENGNVILEC